MLLNDLIERNAQTNHRALATSFREFAHVVAPPWLDGPTIWSEFSTLEARPADPRA